MRSSLAKAAWTVEDKVVWGGAGLLRSALDVVKWPFERAAWAIERGVVWPLERRTGSWDGAIRAGGVTALAVVAAGAGVLGLVLASGSGGGTTAIEARQATPLPAPAAQAAPREDLAQAAPVLHGATPDFTPSEADSAGASKAVSAPPAGETAEATGSTAPATTAAATSSSSDDSAGTATKVVAVGPAATEVAHRFAGAFVDFETGQVDGDVRDAFASTATPLLARRLLRRPPRLPANVKVPRAKVLNIVPGPRHGDTYTLSVSLLRVGVTSELRIDMERDQKTGEWQVTDVLG